MFNAARKVPGDDTARILRQALLFLPWVHELNPEPAASEKKNEHILNIEDNNNIYLDTNATTPLDESVIEAISSACFTAWGNPSSSYESGVTAKNIISQARIDVSEMINCAECEVVFLSGGTEANNMVIYSVVEYYNTHRKGDKGALPHVITSEIEHDSIINPCREMETRGIIELTVVKSQSNGMVKVNDFVDAVRQNTVLVMVMHANNETGVIQPVREIGDGVRERKARVIGTDGSACLDGDRVFVHSDAAQTIGKIPVDMYALGLDYLTVVGHKFYGPRVGALCVRGLVNEVDSTPLTPMMYGGGQERGYRSGTENTPMIAGLGEAARLVCGQKGNGDVDQSVESVAIRMRALRDTFELAMEKAVGTKNIVFNGREKLVERLPNTSNFSLRQPPPPRAHTNVQSDGSLKENLVHFISARDILACTKVLNASVGSACHTSSAKPSRVLTAMGISDDLARCTFRISISRHTTHFEIIRAVELISTSWMAGAGLYSADMQRKSRNDGYSNCDETKEK
eukprot:CFRG0436T1